VSNWKFWQTGVTGQNTSTESLINTIINNIKLNLNSTIACYHTVQKYALLSVVGERTSIFPVALYGCETWSVTLSEGHCSRI
jgi:hypothetical protein